MRTSTLINTLLFATATLSASASLASDKATGSGPNPFSDCGIGAALFPTTDWAAVSSNIIWDIGTTAVTSATASPETCNGKTVETALFINRTYDELAEETARGEGQHLSTMLSMMSCSSENHSRAISDIRSSMAETVSSDSYQKQEHVEKASSYYDMMSSAVNAQCS